MDQISIANLITQLFPLNFHKISVFQELNENRLYNKVLVVKKNH